MADAPRCDLCGQALPQCGYYIVRMEVFADPAMPPLNTEELGKTDFEKAFTELLSELEHYTTEELQDQVHRQFEFRLCRACQLRFLANPLGKPRTRQNGRN